MAADSRAGRRAWRQSRAGRRAWRQTEHAFLQSSPANGFSGWLPVGEVGSGDTAWIAPTLFDEERQVVVSFAAAALTNVEQAGLHSGYERDDATLRFDSRSQATLSWPLVFQAEGREFDSRRAHQRKPPLRRGFVWKESGGPIGRALVAPLSERAHSGLPPPELGALMPDTGFAHRFWVFKFPVPLRSPSARSADPAGSAQSKPASERSPAAR